MLEVRASIRSVHNRLEIRGQVNDVAASGYAQVGNVGFTLRIDVAKAKATMEAAAKAAQEAKRKFEERKKASQKAPLAPVPSSPVESAKASAPTGTLGLFPACYFPRSRCR